MDIGKAMIIANHTQFLDVAFTNGQLGDATRGNVELEYSSSHYENKKADNYIK